MADNPNPWKKQEIDGITISAGERIEYGICLEVGDHTEVVGIFVDGPDMLFAEPTQPAESFVPRQIYSLRGKVKELLSSPRSSPKQPD
ncbi:MAG: hypothetical protein PSX80_09860 [bacterium]|nr:hypothetical protein [bacterium]